MFFKKDKMYFEKNKKAVYWLLSLVMTVDLNYSVRGGGGKLQRILGFDNLLHFVKLMTHSLVLKGY